MRIFEHPKFMFSEMKGVFSSFSFANESEKEAVIALAEKAMSYELTVIPASLYMEYARNGDRAHYEGVYFPRRETLLALLLGTLATESDRYIEKMVDIIWAITEETSWVIPAHNVSKPYRLAGEALPDAFSDDIVEVDLFSAETGALLSWVYHFTKDRLDAVSPVVAKRIEFEIKRRILDPIRKLEMRWMSSFINNWTPWISNNVLVCTAVFMQNPHEKRLTLSLLMEYLDRFVETYGEDGGCNEGASYWTAAVATLFDAIGILHDITGGTIDLFSHPFLKKMCEYFPDVCISPAEKLFANFADCPRHITANRRTILRMGEKTGSEKLCAFAALLPKEPLTLGRFHIYRLLCDLATPDTEAKNLVFRAERTVLYPDLELAILRRGDFFLAVKGGHNRESHNHNDLGTFLLYKGTTPVFVDAGVGVYTRDTFSDKRYTIWTMQSSFHNLPEIDGMMQLPGREHRTDSFTLTDDTVSISYRKAYPAELKASSVTRSITMTDEAIIIRDEITDADSVIFNLLLAEMPEKTDFGFTVGGCSVRFDGTYTVEPVNVASDRNLHKDWNREALYRVRIPSSGTLETVITAEELK